MLIECFVEKFHKLEKINASLAQNTKKILLEGNFYILATKVTEFVWVCIIMHFHLFCKLNCGKKKLIVLELYDVRYMVVDIRYKLLLWHEVFPDTNQPSSFQVKINK